MGAHQKCVKLFEVGGAESPHSGCSVRPDLRRRRRAGDHGGDRSMRKQPGEREIENRVVTRRRECDQVLDDGQGLVVELAVEVSGSGCPL